ncbi:MAG TPA: T9SS type A sorting domain-containing protein [Bacteroidia bacterium]|nr:T9SS type A sorting domain-containing protein [Bacteroidia bacterium]
MRKKLLILSLFCLALFSLKAQTNGGPDAYGYTWRDSNDPNGQPYNWIDITNLPFVNSVKLLADDNVVGPFPMGFNFHYYWYDVDEFRIGSNGYISFNNGNMAVPFPPIPQPSKLNNYIAAFGSDLSFADAGNPGECYFWKSPGNDTLIVSYINVPFWDASLLYDGSNTFQIILSALDSSITFQYQDQQGVYNGLFADFLTVGIENNSGNIGLMHSHDIYPVASYSIKFYPPSTVTYTAIDATCDWVDNVSSGGRFLTKNGTPYEMKSNIRNYGNTVLAPFSVLSEIKSGFSQVVAGTATTDTLIPGQSQILTYPNNTWNHNTTGTFSMITNTQLANDLVPSNNKDTCEFVVIDSTTASQWLSFDDGSVGGVGLSWNGGGPGEGVGMQFPLPYFPIQIDEIRALVVANPTPEGMALKIIDDDGVGGTPLTQLDSVWVDPFSVQVGTYTTVQLTNPIIKTSGSVYVMWEMGGNGISIGQNVTRPISNRSFEVLGGSWSIYRSREDEDFIINIKVSDPTVGIAEQNPLATVFGNMFPNPAQNFVNINYNTSTIINNITLEICDMQGRIVQTKNIASLYGEGSMKVSIAELSAGMYICKMSVNDKSINKRFTIVR